MSGELILIIDDNLMNLKLEKLLLEVENYEILTARDAKEALQVLQTFIPKLILMDLQLPGIDGAELTRQLKRVPQYRDIPVIIVTSYSQKGDEERARAAGCVDYFHKPIDTQALPLVIEKHIRKSADGPSAGEQNFYRNE
jgi:CheY-like chemotaxis protein